MKKLVKLTTLILLLGVALAASWQVAQTQAGDVQIFPETGHTVQGEFLQFYRANPRATLVYGFPITEAFLNNDGVLVQYFSRARMELDPFNGVMLSPLGARLYQAGVPFALSPAPNACRSFGTSFGVCYSFLDFYNTNGGAAQFGLPISPVEQEGEQRVQYFEYAKFEWRPNEISNTPEVRLASLGLLAFYANAENQALLNPPDLNIPAEVLSLQTHIFTEAAAIEMGGAQTVYVVVQDQNYRPVAGAGVALQARGVDGNLIDLFQGVTNASGFAMGVVPAALIGSPGMVLVSAVITYPAALDGAMQMQTSFRVLP